MDQLLHAGIPGSFLSHELAQVAGLCKTTCSKVINVPVRPTPAEQCTTAGWAYMRVIAN